MGTSGHADKSEVAEILVSALSNSYPLEAIRTVSFADIPDVNADESYADAVHQLYQAGVLSGSDVRASTKLFIRISIKSNFRHQS